MKIYSVLALATIVSISGCSSSGGSSSSSSSTTTSTGSTQPSGTSSYSGPFQGTLFLDRFSVNGITAGTYTLNGTTEASANFDTDKMNMQHNATATGLAYSADYQDMTISGSTFTGSTQGSFQADGASGAFNTTVSTSGNFNSDFSSLEGTSNQDLNLNSSNFSSSYSGAKQ